MPPTDDSRAYELLRKNLRELVYSGYIKQNRIAEILGLNAATISRFLNEPARQLSADTRRLVLLHARLLKLPADIVSQLESAWSDEAEDIRLRVNLATPSLLVLSIPLLAKKKGWIDKSGFNYEVSVSCHRQRGMDGRNPEARVTGEDDSSGLGLLSEEDVVAAVSTNQAQIGLAKESVASRSGGLVPIARIGGNFSGRISLPLDVCLQLRSTPEARPTFREIARYVSRNNGRIYAPEGSRAPEHLAALAQRMGVTEFSQLCDDPALWFQDQFLSRPWPDGPSLLLSWPPISFRGTGADAPACHIELSELFYSRDCAGPHCDRNVPLAEDIYAQIRMRPPAYCLFAGTEFFRTHPEICAAIASGIHQSVSRLQEPETSTFLEPLNLIWTEFAGIIGREWLSERNERAAAYRQYLLSELQNLQPFMEYREEFLEAVEATRE